MPEHHPELGNLFDPKQELFVEHRLRPHWSQAGAIVFITFRTCDSVPKAVLERWNREKDDWLKLRGLFDGRHWSEIVPELNRERKREFSKHFNRCREDFLDTCHGRCILRDPRAAKILADALQHFDGVRYQLGDFVVMPNHVHLLASFPTPEGMRKQLTSWLHFTAVEINKLFNQSGNLWQPEPFDHLVRSIEQFRRLQEYIEDNPKKANLSPGEFLHYARNRR